MNPNPIEQIFQKLKNLPSSTLNEVLRYVVFIEMTEVERREQEMTKPIKLNQLEGMQNVFRYKKFMPRKEPKPK